MTSPVEGAGIGFTIIMRISTFPNPKIHLRKFRNTFPVLFLTIVHLLIPLQARAVDEAPEFGNAPVTHGVAIGAVQEGSAIFWSRSDRASFMNLRVEDTESLTVLGKSTPVAAERDFTGKIKIHGLQPDTVFNYRVWFTVETRESSAKFPPVAGQFRTGPSATSARAVTFAWSGDLAGQNVCRDAKEGYPVFNAINALSMDFFIGLGDMIYADNTCEETGKFGNPQIPGSFQPAANMEDYWAHWKYNREDPGYRQLLARVPYFVIWDDHEVVNDFGPQLDTRQEPPYIPGEHLLPLGRRAFEDYNPIAENPGAPHRLYYNVRWGRNLEVFYLDNRQYRDAKISPDNPSQPKTMLGREQMVWLQEKLRSSTALWKVIVSSVPMSIPTGWPSVDGRDGWANFDQETGFENELLDLISFMKGLPKRNFVWITTDVHFAEVFRYTPFPQEDPSFKLHEFVVGPISAGLFPSRDFDTTLNPESLFFHGPETMDSVTDWEEAKKWFNFGVISIDKAGSMTGSVQDTYGKRLFETTVSPER